MKYSEVFQLDNNSWFDFEKVYDMAVDHFPDGSHFVEVGSWQGASAGYLGLKIKEQKKQIQLYCVDLWTGDPNNENEQRIVKSLPSMKEIFKDNMYHIGLETIEDIYTKDFISCPIIMMEGNSNDLLPTFKERSIDFIFIDGGHGHEQVIKDINNAKIIVKSGGWIGGHDYPDVAKVVHEEFDNVETIETSRPNDNTKSSWLVRNL